MNPLAPYIPLVEFLGKAMGPHCEVVLHDVSSRKTPSLPSPMAMSVGAASAVL
jgi:hypothetical protein